VLSLRNRLAQLRRSWQRLRAERPKLLERILLGTTLVTTVAFIAFIWFSKAFVWPPLMRAIAEYDGQRTTHAALRLAPYVFVRPGELRAAEWSEFDLEGAEWRIPAERMKMGETHIVPLSRQATAILRELQPLTVQQRYVFPAIGRQPRPLSDNTLGAALRRIGYSSDEMTAHGFRTLASTLLNEQGWHPDLIELQLAHQERNKVRAAYNRAQRLGERRKMMQAWADYLDALRSGKDNNLNSRATVKRQPRPRGRFNARRESGKTSAAFSLAGRQSQDAT
jgi:integrase